MSKANMEELQREIEMLKEDVEVLTLFAGDDVIMKVNLYAQREKDAKPDVRAKCLKFLGRHGHLRKTDYNERVWNEEYLEKLRDVDRWPYLDMICLVNRNNGSTAVLKYENGTYILVPDVHPNRSFEVPENARRGRKEFLEDLVNEGWKPD
jgi:hypothetical protein